MRVLSGGAAQGLVEAVRDDFESRTRSRIEGTFGAVGAMKARLLAGEPADVMILSRALIDELVHSGHLVAESVRDIGSVRTAIAVRQGDPLPNIDTVGRLQAALSAADEIHFPDPDQATAGVHFAKVMKSLGIWDSAGKHLRPAPNGATAMRALAASHGQRPIGCTQATEILSTSGIVLAAALPPGCDLATTYAAAVTMGASAEAARLVALLTHDDRAGLRQRLGFDALKVASD
jgi:molybdate transport system substrate-binding protein